MWIYSQESSAYVLGVLLFPLPCRNTNPFPHVQKVAAAWSRSNLPPPELDTMFRSIESIYKANRALLGVRSSPSVPSHWISQSMAAIET